MTTLVTWHNFCGRNLGRGATSATGRKGIASPRGTPQMCGRGPKIFNVGDWVEGNTDENDEEGPDAAAIVCSLVPCHVVSLHYGLLPTVP